MDIHVMAPVRAGARPISGPRGSIVGSSEPLPCLCRVIPGAIASGKNLLPNREDDDLKGKASAPEEPLSNPK